jgi:hypothetical protein
MIVWMDPKDEKLVLWCDSCCCDGGGGGLGSNFG